MSRSARRATRAYAFSFVDSANAASDTITMPAGARAGDLAVLFDYAGTESVGPISKVVPSGWTEIADNPSSDTLSRVVVSRRLLGSGEGGGSVAGMNDGFECKVLLVFRPVARPYGFSVPTWNAQETDGNPSSQTVTCASLRCPLIVFGVAVGAGTTTNFSTASPSFDATVARISQGNLVSMRAGYKIYNGSPSDHSIDMNNLGNNNHLLSGLIRVQ